MTQVKSQFNAQAYDLTPGLEFSPLPDAGDIGSLVDGRVRRNRHPVIAFYLPQYHPFAENDQFWGAGFTEWHNVSKAYALFEGHQQPHHPSELGFYDLRVPEVRERQAQLAREHGLAGFCYHHYWFHGRRVMQRPFEEVVHSGKPDFPFCLNWANENWTRRWDGGNNEILINQKYSDQDSANHIRSLYAAFNDRRYIRLNGKPLFLIYNIGSIPEPRRVTDVMRETMIRDGMGDLHLCAAETFAGRVDPRIHGFDSAVEFPPHQVWRTGIHSERSHFRFYTDFTGTLIDYRMVFHDSLTRRTPDFKLFRTVVPSWDNTARLKHRSTVLTNASPELYSEWLYHMLEWTRRNHPGEDAPIFVNAWNEWAEGCHLEPDQTYGRSYLRATRDAILRSNAKSWAVGGLPQSFESNVPVSLSEDPHASLVERDKFWLKYMSLRGLGWPAASDEEVHSNRKRLDEISITRFLYHWLARQTPRLRRTRRASALLLNPLLKRLSSEDLDI